MRASPPSVMIIMLSAGRGGLEQTAFDFAHLYRLIGLSVSFVLDPNSDYLSEQMSRDTPCKTIGNLGDWDPLAAQRIRSHILKTEPTLVHVVGKRAARLTQRRFPTRSGAQLIASTPAKNVAHLKAISTVIVCTDVLRHACLAAGLEDAQLALLPNPVPVPDPLPAIHRIPVDRPVRLGSLGRLSPEKRFDLLIEATAELTRRGIAVETHIAGEGALSEALAQQIQQSASCPARLSGWIDDRDRFFAGCDIYVSTSDRETFGLSLAEAMAHGIPVVATDTDGSCTLVRHGETGRIVPRNDAMALADAIAGTISETQASHDMATRAQDFVARELAHAPLARRLRTILAERFAEFRIP